jgi:hypothetical protein
MFEAPKEWFQHQWRNSVAPMHDVDIVVSSLLGMVFRSRPKHQVLLCFGSERSFSFGPSPLSLLWPLGIEWLNLCDDTSLQASTSWGKRLALFPCLTRIPLYSVNSISDAACKVYVLTGKDSHIGEESGVEATKIKIINWAT